MATWHGINALAAVRTATVLRATPNRCFALPAPPTVEPPVPLVIPAWKGKGVSHDDATIRNPRCGLTGLSAMTDEAAYSLADFHVIATLPSS